MEASTGGITTEELIGFATIAGSVAAAFWVAFRKARKWFEVNIGPKVNSIDNAVNHGRMERIEAAVNQMQIDLGKVVEGEESREELVNTLARRLVSVSEGHNDLARAQQGLTDRQLDLIDKVHELELAGAASAQAKASEDVSDGVGQGAERWVG